MAFEIIYHQMMIKEDISKLSAAWKQKIQRAIETRLMTQPEFYGKPLRKSLKGYRKLRVGDYRVIFRIEDTTVKIFMVAHRSVVYNKVNKRAE